MGLFNWVSYPIKKIDTCQHDWETVREMNLRDIHEEMEKENEGLEYRKRVHGDPHPRWSEWLKYDGELFEVERYGHKYDKVCLNCGKCVAGIQEYKDNIITNMQLQSEETRKALVNHNKRQKLARKMWEDCDAIYKTE